MAESELLGWRCTVWASWVASKRSPCFKHSSLKPANTSVWVVAHPPAKVSSSAAKKSRRKVKVAGYVRRVGGYSYAASEVYTLRADPIRQGSPFDSGFFFDSGLAVYGNQAPF